MLSVVPKFDAQLTSCCVPIPHFVVAVFGAPKVIYGAAMVKSTSLASLATPSTHLTRTRACCVAGPVTVQLNVPEFGAAGVMEDHVLPPSRLISTLTLAVEARLWVQRTA